MRRLNRVITHARDDSNVLEHEANLSRSTLPYQELYFSSFVNASKRGSTEWAVCRFLSPRHVVRGLPPELAMA